MPVEELVEMELVRAASLVPWLEVPKADAISHSHWGRLKQALKVLIHNRHQPQQRPNRHQPQQQPWQPYRLYPCLLHIAPQPMPHSL